MPEAANQGSRKNSSTIEKDQAGGSAGYSYIVCAIGDGGVVVGIGQSRLAHI